MSTLTLQSHCLRPCLHICSRHPLVADVLGNIASSHASIEHQGALATLDVTSSKRGCHILLIDTCSEDQWPAAAKQWRENGGPLIALVTRSRDYITELHAIYLGVHGVVVISPCLGRELPDAIHAVAKGELWMRPDAMAEYARRSFRASSNIPMEPLTDREQQIVKLIQEQFSNRHIAAALQISERTVKFHVSNILQKYRFKNRSSLFLIRPRDAA